MGDGYQEVQEVISIHAPTRGATFQSVPFIDSKRFQSTLPREERQIHIQFFLSKTPYFNPRSHERSDPVTLFCDYQGGFQSTLPREERPRFDAVCQVSASFQSTLPREERRIFGCYFNRISHFNPRSHARSDWCILLLASIS